MFFSVLLGLVVVSVSLFVLWIKGKYSVWKDMGVPYEEPHFLFGNLKDFKVNQHDGELLEKFYYKFKGKGPVGGVFFSFQPIALILDLNLIKNVLVKDFNHFQDRGFFVNESGEPLSAHLASIKGDNWKRMRTKFSPTFTSTKIKMTFPTLLKLSKKLELKIAQISSEHEDFDVKDIASRFTIDAIATCFFGLECNSLNYEENDFFRIARSIAGNPRHSAAVSFLQIAFREYAELLGFKNYRDEISEFFIRTTRQTVDYRMSNDVHVNDFMDLLISMLKDDGDNHITFNQLLAHSFVFFAAGYGTSASTIQFCMYELTRYPEIQEKLRTHIKDVMEKHNGELTFDALSDMKYLDQVIHETLRMYPLLATITREATKDYQVPDTKIILKKGTLIMVPVHAIHHDPEYYPNPYTFDPERFSAENEGKRHPETCLSFGIGPRHCIGGRLGMLQVKMGLIGILRNHQFLLSSKTKLPLKLQSKMFVTTVESPIWIRPVSLNK